MSWGICGGLDTTPPAIFAVGSLLPSLPAPLRRRHGLQPQGVDAASDEIADGVVDQAMLLQERQPFETPRHDHDVIVAAAGDRGGMAGVQRAVIPDLEMHRIELLAQDALDLSGCRRWHVSPPLASNARAHMRLYFGPLPPSRGVQRGPSTLVALQSTQFGALTTRRSPWRS